MSRPNCEQCEVGHDDPKKRRNVKIIEEENENHLRAIEDDMDIKKKQKIMEYHHNNMGHPGIQKTKELIKRSYSWKNMNNDISEFVDQCKPCLERKNETYFKKTDKHFEANEIFEKICIDITGPLPECKGFRYILGVIDVFSRYTMLIPLKNINSKYVVNKLFKRWISLFGIPRIIHSDNGTQFKSDFMMQFCKNLKINQSFSGPYYHQGNGLVERIFRTAKDRIYTTCMQFGTDWIESIPFVEMGMRITINEKIKYSPHEVVFGKQMKPFHENKTEETSQNIIEHLELIKENLKRINQNLKPKNDEIINSCFRFQPGDSVMFRSEEKGLLKKRFVGPCEVIEILPYDNVKLLYKNKTLIRNVKQLKKCHSGVIDRRSSNETSISSRTNKVISNQTSIDLEENLKRRYPNRSRQKPIRLRKLLVERGM